MFGVGLLFFVGRVLGFRSRVGFVGVGRFRVAAVVEVVVGSVVRGEDGRDLGVLEGIGVYFYAV